MATIFRYSENRSKQISMVLLAVGCWLSVYPYFLWGDLWAFIIGAAMAVVGGGLLLLTSSTSKYRGTESWAIIFLTIVFYFIINFYLKFLNCFIFY